jgi:hypothetical protein
VLRLRKPSRRQLLLKTHAVENAPLTLLTLICGWVASLCGRPPRTGAPGGRAGARCHPSLGCTQRIVEIRPRRAISCWTEVYRTGVVGAIRVQ